jgi:ABC-type glycerol-3-phosphate transport system permease component
MNRFTQSTPQVQLPQPSSYAEKSFLHTTGAAVVVPFWQSVIISIAIGLVVFVLSLRFGSIGGYVCAVFRLPAASLVCLDH